MCGVRGVAHATELAQPSYAPSAHTAQCCRAETSAAARFEAFEREKRSVSRNADAPPPGVAVVDAHVLRGGALLDPGRRWVEVEPGWFVVQ